MPTITFTLDDGLMPLDAAHRSGGIAIGRSQFFNGSRVDNFILEDW